MYNHIYQLTHDMDCFFVMNGYPIHIDTNGGIMPARLGTVEEIRAMQTQVANMKEEYDFVLNTGYLNTLNIEDFPSEEELRQLDVELPLYDRIFSNDTYSNIPFHWKVYSQSFAEMARNGFWSFDRMGQTDDGVDVYVLVARPTDVKLEGKPMVGYRFETDEHFWWCECMPLYTWPLVMILASAKNVIIYRL